MILDFLNSHKIDRLIDFVLGGGGHLTWPGKGSPGTPTGNLLVSNISYSGGTIINGGTLRAGNISAFGTGTITVNAGGTLNRNGFAIANVIVNNGGVVV